MISEEKMYHEFRKEIDNYAFPILMAWAKQTGCYRYIMYNGEVVGFLMVIDKYIEGIYVEPEYRRKGLARKAILDYIKEGNDVEKLHIVRSNKVADRFWHSIFELHEIDRNRCDFLYCVGKVKEHKDD